MTQPINSTTPQVVKPTGIDAGKSETTPSTTAGQGGTGIPTIGLTRAKSGDAATANRLRKSLSLPRSNSLGAKGTKQPDSLAGGKVTESNSPPAKINGTDTNDKPDNTNQAAGAKPPAHDNASPAADAKPNVQENGNDHETPPTSTKPPAPGNEPPAAGAKPPAPATNPNDNDSNVSNATVDLIAAFGKNFRHTMEIEANAANQVAEMADAQALRAAKSADNWNKM